MERIWKTLPPNVGASYKNKLNPQFCYPLTFFEMYMYATVDYCAHFCADIYKSEIEFSNIMHEYNRNSSKHLSMNL